MDTFSNKYGASFKCKSLLCHFSGALTLLLCNFIDSTFFISALLLSHIFTVEGVFSIWPTFSFPQCLLLPHSDTAHSETSEHRFMSISGTELTAHCQSPTQIQSEVSVEQNYIFSLPIRDTNGGFPFRAAKYCSYSFLSYSTASYILTSQDV